MYMVGSTSDPIPPIQANMKSVSFTIQSPCVSITTQETNHSYIKPENSEYQGNNFYNVTSIKIFNL